MGKAKFWFNADSEYNGPYPSLAEAKEAATRKCKLDERIEIHQCVYVSEAPKRTWAKA